MAWQSWWVVASSLLRSRYHSLDTRHSEGLHFRAKSSSSLRDVYLTTDIHTRQATTQTLAPRKPAAAHSLESAITNHGLLWMTWNNDLTMTEERLNLWGRHVPYLQTKHQSLVAVAINDPLCVKFMTFHTEHVVDWWSKLLEQCVTTSNLCSIVAKRRYVKYRCHLEGCNTLSQ
jgi:hypothetical protein